VNEEMPKLSALKALETATSSTSLREALLDAVKYRECTMFAEALPRARQRLKELLKAEEEEGNDDNDNDDTVNAESVRLPGTLQEAEAFLSLPVYDEGADEEPANIDVRRTQASNPRRPPPTADAKTCPLATIDRDASHLSPAFSVSPSIHIPIRHRRRSPPA
jgi:hypothetical protein